MNRRRVITAAAVVFVAAIVLAIVMRSAPRDGGRCNLLLITLDTTRADRLGCYGYASALTPALDELAAGGVLFEQAFAGVPLTLPSHATLLTGLQPPEHGLRVNGASRLSSSLPTLAEMLGRQGYRTGAFIAAYALDSDFGLDRGFDTYNDDQAHAYEAYADDPFSQYRAGDLVTDAALAWLDERSEGPFFCWVHLYDPHLPYFAHDALSGTRFSGQASYDAEVAFMDMQVARLMAFLKERDLADRTLVVAVGDHGEGLGEHQELGHGYMVYETTQRVPLVFSRPGQLRQGERAAATVSLVDVFPTILDVLDVPSTDEATGRSLKPALQGDTIDSVFCYGETDMPYTTYGWCPLRSITTPAWKYIRTARVELYNRQADPEELNNLADARPELVRELEAELTAIEHAMTPHTAEPVELSPEGKRILESFGYVGSPRREVNTAELDFSSLPDVKDMLPVAYEVMAMRRLTHQGKLDQALNMCRRIVMLSPGSSRIRFYFGDLLLKRGRTEEAAVQFREVLGIEPDHLEARNNLGRSLLTLGETDEAVEQFIEALQLKPDSAEVLANLGEALLRQGQIDKAIEHCREAVRLKPDLVEAHNNLADALLEQGAVDEAILEWTEALRLDPNNEEAHGDLAMALVRQGSLDEAITHFAKVVQLNPGNDQAHYNLGVGLFQNGQLDEAIAHFREAVRLKPDNPDAHTNLGNALLTQGRIDEAIAHCTEAVRLNPDQLAAHYNLGIALLHKGELDRAIEHFNEVLRIDPNQQDARDKLNAALAERRASSAPQE